MVENISKLCLPSFPYGYGEISQKDKHSAPELEARLLQDTDHGLPRFVTISDEHALTLRNPCREGQVTRNNGAFTTATASGAIVDPLSILQGALSCQTEGVIAPARTPFTDASPDASALDWEAVPLLFLD